MSGNQHQWDIQSTQVGVRYNEFDPPHQARIFHGYGVKRLMFLAGRVPMSDTPTQKHILGLVLCRFFDDALSGVAPSLERLHSGISGRGIPCGSASAFAPVAVAHGVRTVLVRAEALPRVIASPLAAVLPPRSGHIVASGRFTILLAAVVVFHSVIRSANARGSHSSDGGNHGCNQDEQQTHHFLSTQVNVGLVD